MSSDKNKIFWLPDERYSKLEGQTRFQMTKIMQPFNMYGLDVYIPGAVDAIMLVVKATWDVIRGEEKPIDLETVMEKQRRKRK